MRGPRLRGRGQPWLRRALFGGAAACLALAAAAPGADAQSDDAVATPDVFAGSASAGVASFELEREGLLPLSDVFRFVAVDGESTFESSNQEARASLIFPGNGLIQGPSLICLALPPEAPPEFRIACTVYSYPFTVFADPLNPDQSTDGSLQIGAPTDPLSMRGFGARAHTGEESVTTDAEVGDLRILGSSAPSALGIPGLDSTVLRIEEATARTRQLIDENGSLVVESIATLSGVSIAGGLIHIGSIVSNATLVDPDDGDPVPETSIEVSGVTVDGTPAQITEDGLVLGEPQSQVADVVGEIGQGASDALAALGLTMRLLPEESEVTPGGSSQALVGGVLVELAIPVTGLAPVPTPIPGFPEVELNGVYTGSIQLGQVGAASLASTFPDRVPTARVTPSGVSAGGAAATPPRSSSGSAGGSAVAPVAAAAPAAPAAPEAAPDISELIDDLLPDRIALLYLSFTLAALALCIAPRLTLPHRLPGPTPS